MIDVEIKYERSVSVPASPDEVFELLADVGRSGSHFPDVASLTPVGDQGVWRWKMRERGVGPVQISASYDATYSADPETRCVRWCPAPGRHDMDSYGSWHVEPDGDGARLHFEARTVAHIPAPRLMKSMVDAFAKEEIGRMKANYVQAIARALGG